MRMLAKLKILKLKRAAKHHYLIATTLPDDLDCGFHMAEQLRPEIGISREKFNIIMDELAELGESVPETRL